jgi:hypothetical protein
MRQQQQVEVSGQRVGQNMTYREFKTLCHQVRNSPNSLSSHTASLITRGSWPLYLCKASFAKSPLECHTPPPLLATLQTANFYAQTRHSVIRCGVIPIHFQATLQAW